MRLPKTSPRGQGRRLWRPCLLLSLQALLLAALAGQTEKTEKGLPGLAELRTELDGLATKAEAKGIRTGVAVLDVGSGDWCYRHRSREGFIPASNQKLLTAAAVLEELGAGYRFRTEFRLRQGTLEVVAGGDPNWRQGGRHDPERIFRQVAAKLQARAVEAISGLRQIPGPYLGPARPPGWPEDQFNYHYCAPTAGLVLEEGCLRLRISAGRGPGARNAQVQILAPPVDLPIQGSLPLTSSRKEGGRYGFLDLGGKLRLQGAFYRQSPPVTIRAAAQDPSDLFLRALRHVLLAQGLGIGVAGAAAEAGEEGGEDGPVMTYETGLEEALLSTLKESSNFHAEQLLRVLGAEKLRDGSFAGGAGAMREVLGDILGELPEGLVLADGSGLSRQNRCSPELLAGLLQKVISQSYGKILVAALPQGGVDGTLKRRFRKEGREAVGLHLRAKTGTLYGVSCLTGLLRLPSGRLLLFSILMQRSRGGSTRGMQGLQEEMVLALYRSGE